MARRRGRPSRADIEAEIAAGTRDASGAPLDDREIDEQNDRDDESRIRFAARPASAVELDREDLEKLALDYTNEIDWQLSQRATQEADWNRWEDLYDSQSASGVKNCPYPNSSNVVVAVAATFTDKMVAKIMRSIFALEPHWTTSARSRTLSKYPKPLEEYLDFCRSDLWDQYAVVKEAVLETAKIGTSIITSTFVDEILRRYDDGARQTVQAGRKYGPRPLWVPRHDFLIPEGYTAIKSAPWIAYRQWFSWQRIKALAWNNVFEGDFEKLVGKPDDDAQQTRFRRTNPGESARSADKESGLWACWQVWFQRDLDDDGYPEEYVMVLHPGTKTILRLRPNPYVDAMRPFVVLRYVQREGRFDGIGIPEMVEHLQEEASTIHNQRRDNAHFANIRMFKGRAVGGIPDSIQPVSGRVLKMQEPATDLVEFKLSDLRQVDAFEENIVIQWAKERVGLSDPASGQITSPVGRAAATTVMAVLQEGAERSDLNISEIRHALSELGQQVCELLQYHGLPGPDMPGAPEAVLDPDKAAIVRELFEQPDDIRGLVRVKLNVATAAVNREVEKQSNIQLYGIVTQYLQQTMQLAAAIQNPQVPQPIRESIVRGVQGLDLTMKRIFAAHSAYDLEGVLVGEIMQQMLAQPAPPPQQMLGGPGGEGAPNGSGMPPPEMPPGLPQ